jgi:hypothetical protein
VTNFEEQECISCFVRFGVPKGFTAARRQDKRSFYCPNGHSMSYTRSTADELRDQLAAKEREAQNAKAEAERERRWRIEAREDQRALERRLAAQRGVTTRMKNRVANGVCPCCNRTFVNLQRHMASKHAGFVAEEVQEQVGRTLQ